MAREEATELLLIRHAPQINGGRLAGRRDVPADCSDAAAFAGMRAALGVPPALVVSPALRCQQTAGTLWPELTGQTDPRFWEQDFGDWEGLPFGDLPDIGALSTAELAAHRPPQGESFADLHARIAPALQDVGGRGGQVAIVAHAGIVRVALALATGSVPGGLAFQIAPLSLTRVQFHPRGGWSVAEVNRVFA